MKNNSFDLLDVLIAVAESRNFREAADKLKLSQPAISMKLKELQGSHPFTLFQLEGKRKVLTHYGRNLYELAKISTLSLDRSIESLHRVYSDEKQLVLRIGARSEVFNYIAPHLEFDGQIEFVSLTSQDSVKKLLSHEIDIAFSYFQPDSTEIIAKKIFESSAFLIVHDALVKKKKLNTKHSEDLFFLKTTPCIFYQKEGHIIRDWVQSVGLKLEELNVRFIVEDWRTVQNLVSQGFGYAIVPEYMLSADKQVQNLLLPKSILKPYVFYALFEKSLKKIPAFQRVLAFSKF